MSESDDLTEGSTIDPGSQAWLDSVVEDVIDPDVPIIDTHHHLWPEGGAFAYGLSDLEADLGRGHNIVDSVFVECRASYDDQAPLHLAPVGETEFVVGEATHSSRRLMSGIVAHADLTDLENLDEVLDAHFAAADGRLRGIRHSGPHARHPEVLMIPGRATAGLYADEQFRAGVERLGERGLSYDTWHYHYQNQDFAELARAVPGTAMVLDHFGTPLGVGPYETQREEIYERWRLDIVEIAECDNVMANLGGLAMPDNGFGWNTAARPPTSDEFVEAQRRYYLHTIESFGPERCMFESNFPVDRLSLSYLVLWNGFKKMVADFSPAERDALFRGTATRIYRLDS
jgi:L-fuconolactonase